MPWDKGIDLFTFTNPDTTVEHYKRAEEKKRVTLKMKMKLCPQNRTLIQEKSLENCVFLPRTITCNFQGFVARSDKVLLPALLHFVFFVLSSKMKYTFNHHAASFKLAFVHLAVLYDYKSSPKSLAASC